MRRKSEAEKIYNERVEKNIKNNCDENNYKDPDVNFCVCRKPIIFIDNNNKDEVKIRMASDGLCGIKKIRKFCKKNITDDYRILREGKFKILSWPIQSLSINQKRGFVYAFDDRLDLTLMDIQDFYNCIEGKRFSVEVVNEIKKQCVMCDVFLNEPTLMWLCSFKNFDDFITSENLKAFVKQQENEKYKYKADSWIGDSKEKREAFTQEYYDELLKRAKQWTDEAESRKFYK